MTNDKVKQLIQQGENLDLEFKSDQKCLPDRDLVAAIISLANTNGGTLLLGVEDNGEITGLHARHVHTGGLPALIANKTNPALAVTVESVVVDGCKIACIYVPKVLQLTSTSNGLLLKRRLKLDGLPEAVPFYPHEFLQRQSSLGLIDPSAMVVKELSTDVFDPLQRQRLRHAIKTYNGDQALLTLADNELDGALGLCREEAGILHPTITGILLLGTEDILQQYIPAFENAFQVLQGTEVRVNEFLRKPLLETFERIEILFQARVEEEEVQIGLFRVPVPNYDRRAFREALVNALVHRDYSRLGAVHIKLDDDGLQISNPGGFIDGVRLDNILVAPPRSRNPLLADVIKRIGLAERTGRGIDRIYEGMLRYGRPIPDYSMSDDFTVSVHMLNAKADFEFLKMIIDQENNGGSLPVDSLIILSKLKEERRLHITDFQDSVQKPEVQIRSMLEKLIEKGLVEAHGTGKSRSYTLSATIYRKAGEKSEYVRQAGFDALQQEQMILKYIDAHGYIKRADVADLCRISPYQATRLLAKLRKLKKIRLCGNGKASFYERQT